MKVARKGFILHSGGIGIVGQDVVELFGSRAGGCAAIRNPILQLSGHSGSNTSAIWRGRGERLRLRAKTTVIKLTVERAGVAPRNGSVIWRVTGAPLAGSSHGGGVRAGDRRVHDKRALALFDTCLQSGAKCKNGLILIRHTAHLDPRALFHVDDFTVEISVIRINLSVLADGIQEAQGGQVTKFNCVRRTLKV